MQYSEGHEDIKKELEIKNLPAYMLIYGDQVYEYDGGNNMNDIVEFVKGGYKKAKARKLLRPVSTTEKVMALVRMAFDKCEELMNGMGLTMIPRGVKIMIILGLIPLIISLMGMMLGRKKNEGEQVYTSHARVETKATPEAAMKKSK